MAAYGKWLVEEEELRVAADAESKAAGVSDEAGAGEMVPLNGGGRESAVGRKAADTNDSVALSRRSREKEIQGRAGARRMQIQLERRTQPSMRELERRT